MSRIAAQSLSILRESALTWTREDAALFEEAQRELAFEEIRLESMLPPVRREPAAIAA